MAHILWFYHLDKKEYWMNTSRKELLQQGMIYVHKWPDFCNNISKKHHGTYSVDGYIDLPSIIKFGHSQVSDVMMSPKTITTINKKQQQCAVWKHYIRVNYSNLSFNNDPMAGQNSHSFVNFTVNSWDTKYAVVKQTNLSDGHAF